MIMPFIRLTAFALGLLALLGAVIWALWSVAMLATAKQVMQVGLGLSIIGFIIWWVTYPVERTLCEDIDRLDAWLRERSG